MKAEEYAQQIEGGSPLQTVLASMVDEMLEVARKRNASTVSAKAAVFREFKNKWSAVIGRVKSQQLQETAFSEFYKAADATGYESIVAQYERDMVALKNASRMRSRA